MSDGRRELPFFQREKFGFGPGFNRACRMQASNQKLEGMLGAGGGPSDASQTTNPGDIVHKLPYQAETAADMVAAIKTEGEGDEDEAETLGVHEGQLPNPLEPEGEVPQGVHQSPGKTTLTVGTVETQTVDPDTSQESEGIDGAHSIMINLDPKHKDVEDKEMIKGYFDSMLQQMKDQGNLASGDAEIIDEHVKVTYTLIPAIVPPLEPDTPVDRTVKIINEQLSEWGKNVAPINKEESKPGPSTEKESTKAPKPTVTSIGTGPTPPIKGSVERTPAPTASSPSQSLTDLVRKPVTYDRRGGGSIAVSLLQLGISADTVAKGLASKGVPIKTFLARSESQKAWACLMLSERGKKFRLTVFPPEK
nr:MAG: ORF2 [Wuhan Tick Virus 1]